MIVRELIDGAVWRPGRDYDRASPAVSVLLPTYRRAAGGLFLRAARSILSQTFQRLELIVVDDASTDGTAEQIETLMREDARVSCVTHVRNIGLPAVSIFEAYQRARAPYLVFGFDDFVFRPDAIARLWDAAERMAAGIVHGHARMVHTGTSAIIGRRGKDFRTYERLRQENVIPNACVLLRRDVVEQIGWYDPHVLLVRCCDFDLWRRLARRHLIEPIPVNVGAEFGPSLADSLGNTHPFEADAIEEFMDCRRDHLLTPDAFLDRDVEAPFDGISDRLVAAIERAAGRWRAQTGIVAAQPRPSQPPPRLDHQRLRIVGWPNASLSLTFDGLFHDRGPVQFIFAPTNSGGENLRAILGATAVVFDYRLFLYDGIMGMLRACEALEIPAYLILDDNPFALLGESIIPSHQPFARRETIEICRRLAGLIVTSASLRDDPRIRELNDDIVLLSPTWNQDLLPDERACRAAAPGEPLRIAVAGGPHREADLEGVVIPALASLAPRHQAALIVRAHAARSRRLAWSRGLPVTAEGTYESFTEFVLRWRARRPHLLVHPRGRTQNIDFKTDNAVLVAYLLGAVPVVGDERAYAGLGEAEGVVKVEGCTAASWAEAIASLADADSWRGYRARLAAFCKTRFDPALNEAVLAGVMSRHPACDAALHAARARALAAAPDLVNAAASRRTSLSVLHRVWRGCPPDLKRVCRPFLAQAARLVYPRAMLPPT